ETAWRRLEATPLIPDGAGGIWVAFGGAGSYLGRFDLESETWDCVELPHLQPSAMTFDRDGNLWFTSFPNSRIGRLRPNRDLEVWEHAGNPFGITTTPQGEIWVAEFSANRLTRLDPATAEGALSVELPTEKSEPLNLTSDPSGALWYAAQTGRVGYVGPTRDTAPSLAATTIELSPDPPRLRDIAPALVGPTGDL